MLSILIPFVFLDNVHVVFTACIPADKPATFIWPLGENINHFEINTLSWTGSANQISYATGPIDLGYNALAFNGTHESYVDTRVQSSVDTTGDLAISFNVFPEENGVIFHYRSDEFDNPTGTFRQSIKLAWYNGNIETYYSNGSTETMSTSPLGLANNDWYNLILEIDISKTDVSFSGAIISSVAHDAWISNVAIKFPGSLRIGGSLDDDGFFTGRISCIQLIPCKNPSESYNPGCDVNNWIQYTTTSTTSTSTTSTSTTSTSTTSTSTTSTSTTSTSTTSTTTSTTSTTTSTPSTSTPATFTTRATTPATTSTSTLTIATTIHAATSTSTVPSSTTNAPSTSHFTVATTTQTTASTPILSWLTPAEDPFKPQGSCLYYHQLQSDTTLDDSSVTVLSKIVVSNILECSKLCSQHGQCETFAFNVGICRIGTANPITVFESGSYLFGII